jgi:hypothetical protein
MSMESEIRKVLKPEVRDGREGMPDIVAAVGLSLRLEAYEAGREAAAQMMRDMGGQAPDIVILYSTIHYREFGGFQKLLDGIYSAIPAGTHLIGGTTAGFIIPQGCYTSGVAAFGLKTSKAHFSIAVAKNIKRHPILAAKQCAEKIERDLAGSPYKNRFVLSHPSGITTPKIPGFPDNLRVIHSKLLSELLLVGTHLSLLLMQKGPGREEDIIEVLAKRLPDYQMIGGSFVDDNKGYFNYQFHDREVGTNMLITLGIATEYGISVNSTFGLTPTDKIFKVTKKSTYDLVIEKINGKDAFNQMLKILNWPAYFMEDSARILRRTFYSPIGYTINGKQYVSVMAFIFGESIMVSPKIRCDEVCIMTTSGKELLDSVEENLAHTRGKDIKFGLITSCIVRLETLGREVYQVHRKMMEHFNGRPFIQMYAVGEDVYTKEIGAKRIAESYNTAVFYGGGS